MLAMILYPGRQAAVVHECTPRFRLQILREHLPMYEWFELPLPNGIISPHHLGKIFVRAVTVVCESAAAF